MTLGVGGGLAARFSRDAFSMVRGGGLSSTSSSSSVKSFSLNGFCSSGYSSFPLFIIAIVVAGVGVGVCVLLIIRLLELGEAMAFLDELFVEAADGDDERTTAESNLLTLLLPLLLLLLLIELKLLAPDESYRSALGELDLLLLFDLLCNLYILYFICI